VTLLAGSRPARLADAADRSLVAPSWSVALNFTFIEKVAYRPLRNAPRLAPLITAMGMSLLLQTLAMIIWKPNPTVFRDPAADRADHIGGAVHQRQADPDPGGHGGDAGGPDVLVNRTKLGRAMRATAENPRVAGLMGVRPDQVISATFASARRWPRWPA
jgi:branched-chain amino acid transport system permease protein